MKITLLRSYPKLEDGHIKLDRKGNPIIVFVYRVTGSKTELEAYEKAQGEAEVSTIKDDQDNHLWFTVRPVGVTGELQISPNGKVYADTTKLDLANAMINQWGLLGQSIAKEIMHDAPANPTITADTPAEEPLDMP